METKRFQLEGPTLHGLTDRVRAEHGPDALIVAAERVTVGGIRGFFARQHYEVTVEVPPARRPAAHARLDLPARLGIAALLDDADEIEARVHAAPAGQAVSTESDGFAALMDELTFATARVEPGPPARAPAPAPLRNRGDLVVVVGLLDESVAVARSMIAAAGSGELRVGGAVVLPGVARVDDRRSALAARARGVERGHSTVVAFGLGRPGRAGDSAAALRSVGADQVWVVVDAARKTEDTLHWVSAVTSMVPVDAIAAVGRELTLTPDTVHELGLPVEWMPAAPNPANAER